MANFTKTKDWYASHKWDLLLITSQISLEKDPTAPSQDEGKHSCVRTHALTHTSQLFVIYQSRTPTNRRYKTMLKAATEVMISPVDRDHVQNIT